MALKIDHGRLDEPGCVADWKKIARYEKLENLRVFFKTAQIFWGEMEKQVYSSFRISMA
jgi:hypothetical protein